MLPSSLSYSAFCLPLAAVALRFAVLSMEAVPPNRLQRTPRLRLGCKPSVTGAGSVSLNVRDAGATTMKGIRINRRCYLWGTLVCVVLVYGLVIFVRREHHPQAFTALGQRSHLPTVTIASNGKMYLAGKQVTVSQLEAILRQSR